MTKIEEFENRIIKAGMSEEDFTEYEKLLKRVHDNFLKLQHCYTTAIQFPVIHSEQAIRLIQWGLQKYPDDWFSTYTAHLYMGNIYENSSQYRKAYDAYRQAYDDLGEDQLSYRQHLSGDLLWILLHINDFRYSEQLEEYYALFVTTDEFNKAFINSEFHLMVAEIVISLHHGNVEEAKQAYQKALCISRPGFISRMQGILDRHQAKDTLKVTPECTRFLKSLEL